MKSREARFQILGKMIAMNIVADGAENVAKLLCIVLINIVSSLKKNRYEISTPLGSKVIIEVSQKQPDGSVQ